MRNLLRSVVGRSHDRVKVAPMLRSVPSISEGIPLAPPASTSHALPWMTNAPLNPISILLRPGKRTRVDGRVGFDAKAFAAPRHQSVDTDARGADPADPPLTLRIRGAALTATPRILHRSLSSLGGGGCKVSRSDFAPQITIYTCLTKTQARLRNR